MNVVELLTSIDSLTQRPPRPLRALEMLRRIESQGQPNPIRKYKQINVSTGLRQRLRSLKENGQAERREQHRTKVQIKAARQVLKSQGS